MARARGIAGKIVIVNSDAGYCAQHYADEYMRAGQDVRWGPPGDYALALRAMRENGLEIREIVCRSLDQVIEPADWFHLRDWRYSYDALAALIARFPNARTSIDLRINPFEVHCLQRRGEFSHVCGDGKHQTWHEGARFRYSSRILSLASVAFIGSELNRSLLIEIGRYSPNMQTRPHVTPWLLRDGQIAAMGAGRTHVEYDRFRVLYVGRSAFRKGLFRLLRALKLADLPAWELVAVTGDLCDARPPPRTEQIEELLSHPNVKVLPFTQSQREMIHLYHRSHVYVCPSLSDNGPNTVIESMVCGLPVLVSDMCGAAEVVPEPYRVVFKAPKWWRDQDLEGCEQEIAEALCAYHRDVFLRKKVVEYGEELRRAYLEADLLGELYSQYTRVFTLDSCQD